MTDEYTFLYRTNEEIKQAAIAIFGDIVVDAGRIVETSRPDLIGLMERSFEADDIVVRNGKQISLDEACVYVKFITGKVVSFYSFEGATIKEVTETLVAF